MEEASRLEPPNRRHDLIKTIRSGNPVPHAVTMDLVGTGVFLVITFMLFLYVLTIHQDWEQEQDGKPKRIRLGIACNLIGFGLMIAFLLWVKGIE
jgi:hypothetical protein